MASGTCGENLTWTLNNGTLTISGKGEMKNWIFFFKHQWLNYSKTIEGVVIEYGVTSIGDNAFYDCSLLKSITIPDSVTSIGEGAFHDCNSLMNITIPNSVSSIRKNAFWRCNSLNSITIPSSVISIGDSAFFGCNNLTSIIIPDSITSIGDSAFDACRELISVTIPNNVISIGEWIFFRCSNLKKIHYPAWRGFEKNLSQGNHAQLIPYSGTPPVIKPKPIFKPPTPQPIRKYTSPPAQVKPTPQPVIKPEPQAVVESLRWKVEGKTLTVGGVSEIKSYSYEETPWRDSFRDIQRIIIEEGVKKIAANAFAECTRLEQLTIPVSVKTIGDGAFTFCYCGDRTINGGRNVIWSLEDGTLMIKKNPAAKNESNFSTGYETWQVVEGNITGVKIERGIVPANSFFDWVNRMGDGVSVTF